MLISDWSSDVCSSDLNFLSLCLSPAHDFGIVRAPSDRAPKRRPHPVSIRSRPRSHFSPFRLEVRGFAVYHYDEIDQTLVTERAAQFREQVARYHAGKLSEDEFRALRLRNGRSEEHTSELQSLTRISYAVFCWKKKQQHTPYQY